MLVCRGRAGVVLAAAALHNCALHASLSEGQAPTSASTCKNSTGWIEPVGLQRPLARQKSPLPTNSRGEHTLSGQWSAGLALKALQSSKVLGTARRGVTGEKAFRQHGRYLAQGAAYPSPGGKRRRNKIPFHPPQTPPRAMHGIGSPPARRLDSPSCWDTNQVVPWPATARSRSSVRQQHGFISDKVACANKARSLVPTTWGDENVTGGILLVRMCLSGLQNAGREHKGDKYLGNWPPHPLRFKGGKRPVSLRLHVGDDLLTHTCVHAHIHAPHDSADLM